MAFSFNLTSLFHTYYEVFVLFCFALFCVLFCFFPFFTCLLIFKEKGKEDVKLDEWGVGDDLGGDEEGTIVIRIHGMKKTN